MESKNITKVLTNLSTEIQQPEILFDEIAETVFFNFQIKAGNNQFRITEIEFYFYAENHKDVFTHCNILQKKMGYWYFHGSGVDITFGNENIYASFLIRGVKNIGNNSYISGPLNVMKEIFESLSPVSNISKLGIEYSETEHKIIAKCTRIGLKISKSSDFFQKKYRYITCIEPTHKFKEKTNVAAAILAAGHDFTTLEKQLGYRIASKVFNR